MSICQILFPEGSLSVKSKKAVRVLGIDLGTTNSTIAEIVYKPSARDDIKVRCLPVEQPAGTRSHWHPLHSRAERMAKHDKTTHNHKPKHQPRRLRTLTI